LYIEPKTLGRVERIGKRVFDVSAAGLALVVAGPIMIAAAVAIKLDDGGQVFFRQIRVGLRGEEFGVLKLRTMSVNAERMLATLGATNERQGPLFKMQKDPRVTRVGRFLRTSSLDELPQLFNVLRGEMSLVGPRPALPSEVAQFPPELRSREAVLPGITGLWQVEARDNPSFEAYRRLDLFYVENWSIVLDLLIIVGTIEQLIVKMMTSIRPASHQAVDSGAGRDVDQVVDRAS
jgi:lipopolysaccharide/colanic/teichoic acid biosynthesis glycosyltransferase